jgi:hypothetical protein
MLLRTKGTRILAGLAVMAMLSIGGGVAHAGKVTLGGQITPLPGGSPFLYEFELFLDFGTIAPGSSLMIGTPPLGLVGVNQLSGTTQPPTIFSPNDIWVVPPGGIVTTGSGPYGTESSVTWDFISGTTYTNSPGSPLLETGLFNVETAFTYPDNMPPAMPGTVIDYVFTFADGTTSSGTVTLTPIIPEPSSIILFLAGVGVLPLLRTWVKRSRSPRVA